MSILDIPTPPITISVLIAEHPRHLVRAYRRPVRFVAFVMRPSQS